MKLFQVLQERKALKMGQKSWEQYLIKMMKLCKLIGKKKHESIGLFSLVFLISCDIDTE